MLGIKRRDDAVAMGIDQYNAECRMIVSRTTTILGRWIDYENGENYGGAIGNV